MTIISKLMHSSNKSNQNARGDRPVIGMLYGPKNGRQRFLEKRKQLSITQQSAQAAISASMASASTGTSRVISSQPLSVTTASSSMRMPMFQNSLGMPSLGRT